MFSAEKTQQNAIGWAARDASGVLSPFSFGRRANGESDITVKILYCGICHTDVHYTKNHHGFSIYPLIPGHEIVGEVAEVGLKVQNFKLGDKVGVGAYVRSCRACEQCEQDLESYCPKVVHTFSETDYDGSITQGGYSDKIVVDEHYVVRIPDELPLAAAAPLLCAGITVYSPIRYYGLDKPGLHVGVVGLGGLGHIAVKFCKALGAKVTVISTSPGKKEEAVQRLGADEFLISHNEEQMKEATGSLDGIIDTVSAAHPIAPLVGLLKAHGKLVLLGAMESAELPVIPILIGRRLVGGSNTGGMKETQEMMNFAAKHNVVADVEVVAMDYVNEALERLERGDVKYRFVIDVANTLKKDQ